MAYSFKCQDKNFDILFIPNSEHLRIWKLVLIPKNSADWRLVWDDTNYIHSTP